MNYTELKTAIQETMETSFTEEQLSNFIQLTETKIYNTVQIPALRKNATGNTTADVRYLGMPTDFLYPYSIACIDADGRYSYLTMVDTSFIREAYPNPATTARPKYYAIFDEDTFLLGPTPDSSYPVQIHYGSYPESIVTAGNTWVGDNFEGALLNGALVEAARFQKAEQDIVAMYDKMYAESITLLKNLADGKLRQDTYKTMQVRTPVS